MYVVLLDLWAVWLFDCFAVDGFADLLCALCDGGGLILCWLSSFPRVI